MCGLTLERSEENLAFTFLAVMQALAYGTKHILQELQKYGSIKFHSIVEIRSYEYYSSYW